MSDPADKRDATPDSQAGTPTPVRTCAASQLAAARTELLGTVHALQARADHAERDAAYARHELDTLKATRGVRAARLLSDARGWRDWLALPIDLLRVLASPGPAPAAPPAPPPTPAPGPMPPSRTREGAPTATLRIAAILDEFTATGLAPDAELWLLDPEAPAAQLDAFAPDLLLVESAWRGNDGRWSDRLVPVSRPMHDVLEWCSRHGVPTVFWNKEDPTHYDWFLVLARHFDHVYTTDAGRLPDYRAALGRDDVGVLPFACQPALHHPLETHVRATGATFAGSYYPNYPERARDFDRMIDALAPLMPVTIHDRNHGDDDGEFAFPERFHALVAGRLPPADVVEAAKRFTFAINMNSVVDSPTMFARRVFELTASNTVVLSNPSAGMTRLFGDAVVVDGPDFAGRVQRLRDDPAAYRRLRLAALRTTMSAHTWRDRLARIAADVLGHAIPAPAPTIVVARVRDADEIDRVVRARARQDVATDLVLVGEPALRPHAPADARWVDETQARSLVPATAFAGRRLAAFSPDDHYGAHYLLDLELGFRFATASVVGKAARFRRDGTASRLEHDGAQYRAGATLAATSSLFRADALTLPLGDWLDGGDEPRWPGVALDEFNYCRGGAELEAAGTVDDAPADGTAGRAAATAAGSE